MALDVTFHGVRGTAVATGAAFARYGADTTCLSLRDRDGGLVVLDAGTGLAAVAGALPEAAGSPSLPIFLTHFHLDHLMGLPAFGPLYDPRRRIEFASRQPRAGGTREALGMLLREPLWPVSLEQTPAAKAFSDLPERCPAEGVARGGLVLRYCAVHHNSPCSAYRVDEPATGAAMVFATDMEWPLADPGEREVFMRLCREPAPVRLLVLDGQYDRAGYPAHRGWGHSSWEDAVAIARDAGAARLVVTHHAPAATDGRLDRAAAALQEEQPGAALARQGMTIRVEDT